MNKRSLTMAISAGAFSLALSGALFGQEGYQEKSGAADRSGAMQSSMPQIDLSAAYKASDLVDMDVKNRQDEDLGKISDLVIDKDGKVSHAVLQEGGVLGMGENKYVIPWDRISLSRDQEVAVIDVQRDALSSEFAAFQEEKSEMEKQDSGTR